VNVRQFREPEQAERFQAWLEAGTETELPD